MEDMNTKRGGPGSRRWEQQRKCQAGTCQARTIFGRKIHIHSIGDVVAFGFLAAVTIFGVFLGGFISAAFIGGAIMGSNGALLWWLRLSIPGVNDYWWGLAKLWLF